MLAELVGKLNRCLILEARVRPYSVVMLEPQTDHDLGLGAGTKPFEAQALVAELAVEAFVHAILPRFAWINQHCVDALGRYPA